MAAARKFVSLLVLFMLVSSPMTAQAAITCGQLTANVGPCLVYLWGGPRPLLGCCNGVRDLLAAAKTTADRQQACQCLKSTASALGVQINSTVAANLSKDCNVTIPYNISMSTNCSSVK